MVTSIVLITLAALSSSTWAVEYQRDEEIAPESANEVTSPLRGSIQPDRKQSRQSLGERIDTAVSFWRDSEVGLKMRLFDFTRKNGDTTLSEALAGGAELRFASGRWRERISIGASWYGSYGVDAAEDKDGTKLLGPDQSDISVLGKAYAKIHFGSVDFQLYRQDFRLPYLNRQDSRMIPNTHEGYVLRRLDTNFNFIVGHISKMKLRDSEQFLPMAEIAGVEDDNTGTNIAGVLYQLNQHFDVGTLVLRTPDVFQTSYAEGTWRNSFDDGWDVQLGIQGTDQRSVGADQLGSFQTGALGLRSVLGYRNSVLTVAYTTTNDTAEIRKPYGGTPGFTSLMLSDFDRAGEDAWYVGLSQNFKRLGLPGFGLRFGYARGRNAHSDEGVSLADESEFDLTADFRPPTGKLKGLWLRVRVAYRDRSNTTDDRYDVRLILNYELTH